MCEAVGLLVGAAMSACLPAARAPTGMQCRSQQRRVVELQARRGVMKGMA